MITRADDSILTNAHPNEANNRLVVICLRLLVSILTASDSTVQPESAPEYLASMMNHITIFTAPKRGEGCVM